MSSSLSTSTASPCHCSSLRKATRRVTQLYDSFLLPTGLKLTQFSILAEIARRSANPPTMRELADAMVMDRSTLGHNLRPLERERLVELASHKGDGRSRLVLLTATGHSKYVEAKGPWKKAQARFEAAYGVQPAAELRSTLLEVATLDYSASF